MARAHGKSGAAYVSPNGTGVAVALGALTAWTLDRSTEKVDVSAMQDTNKSYVQGLPDLKGTLAAWWDSATDPLYAAGISTDGVKLYLYPSTLTPTVYDYGPAWLDTSINVGVSGAVSISANFVAAGSWGHKP